MHNFIPLIPHDIAMSVKFESMARQYTRLQAMINNGGINMERMAPCHKLDI